MSSAQADPDRTAAITKLVADLTEPPAVHAVGGVLNFVGIWAIINSMALLFPSYFQATPIYGILHNDPFPGWVWGVIIFLIGTKTIFAGWRPNNRRFVPTMIFNSWLWMMMGIWLLFAGFQQNNRIAGGGIFWIICAIACGISAIQHKYVRS